MIVSIFAAVAWLLCSLIYFVGTIYVYAADIDDEDDDSDPGDNIMMLDDDDEEHGPKASSTAAKPKPVPSNIHVHNNGTDPYESQNSSIDGNDHHHTMKGPEKAIRLERVNTDVSC